MIEFNAGLLSQASSTQIGDLRIDGDSTDRIELNGEEWSLGEFKTDSETNQTYQEYTAGEGDATVTLEISTEIEVQDS